MKISNNRKRTAGRKFTLIPKMHIVGYTVIAKPLNADGTKTNILFRKFVEVEHFTNKDKIDLKNSEAYIKANNIAKKQKFDTLIIPKVYKTSVKIYSNN